MCQTRRKATKSELKESGGKGDANKSHGEEREQQSEQNKRRIFSASSISSVPHQAAPLKRELTTDNQLAGGRPNFQRRAAEIKHLICTEVNNHILYGAITWSNGRGGSVETCSLRTDFTTAVGPLLLRHFSSNAFMLIGAGMMYEFDTKNTHAFKIVKLLEIPSPLCWAGDNVHIFMWMSWRSQPTYSARVLLGRWCDDTSKPFTEKYFGFKRKPNMATYRHPRMSPPAISLVPLELN